MTTMRKVGQLGTPADAALPAANRHQAEGEASASVVPPASMSIFDMARRVRAMTLREEELWTRKIGLDIKSKRYRALDHAIKGLFQEREAWVALILALRAETVADAAAQARFSLCELDNITGLELTIDEVYLRIDKIARAQASIVLALSQAAGLDPDSFGWDEAAMCCGSRFPDEGTL